MESLRHLPRPPPPLAWAVEAGHHFFCLCSPPRPPRSGSAARLQDVGSCRNLLRKLNPSLSQSLVVEGELAIGHLARGGELFEDGFMLICRLEVHVNNSDVLGGSVLENLLATVGRSHFVLRYVVVGEELLDHGVPSRWLSLLDRIGVEGDGADVPEANLGREVLPLLLPLLPLYFFVFVNYLLRIIVSGGERGVVALLPEHVGLRAGVVLVESGGHVLRRGAFVVSELVEPLGA